MIGTILLIFIVLAAAALLYWGIKALPLPPVIQTVLTVVLGLLLLLMIYNAVAGGHMSLTVR